MGRCYLHFPHGRSSRAQTPAGCWVIWGLAGGSLLFATSQGLLTRNPTRGSGQKSRHRQQPGRATRLPTASRSLKKWVAVQGSHWNGFTMRNVGCERCLTSGNSTALHLNSPDRNRNKDGSRVSRAGRSGVVKSWGDTHKIRFLCSKRYLKQQLWDWCWHRWEKWAIWVGSGLLETENTKSELTG